MGRVFLESRLKYLLGAQNSDGGWGYFAGKQSWLEPAAYALLALQGTAVSESDHGWQLLRSWQSGDGSWRPCAQVRQGTWCTSLAVTVAAARGAYDDTFTKGVKWLADNKGAESRPSMRLLTALHLVQAEDDTTKEGWPWLASNSSWIEPTAHALIALKKSFGHYPTDVLDRRVRDGEQMIFTRRCRDGGWNYGNKVVLNQTMPSYPETTGIALLGLQGRSDLGNAIDTAHRFWSETQSPLAKAWLTLALRCCDVQLPAPPDTEWSGNDVMLAALEALGDPSGNFPLLIPGVAV